MKLYTNKFPVLAGCPPLQQDNTIEEKDIDILFPEGKIFKVKAMNFQEILLESGGKIIPVNANLFSVAFEESEVEV